MGEYDTIIICKITDQRVNVTKKGRMSRCDRCYVKDCEALSYPMRVYK